LSENLRYQPNRRWLALPAGRWVDIVTISLGVLIVAITVSFAADLTLLRQLEIPKEQALPLVLGSTFLIVFLRLPARRGAERRQVPLYDIVLGSLGFLVCLYFSYIYIILIEDYFYYRDTAFIIGIIVIPLTVEALRRTAGWSLVAVLMVFLIYSVVGHLVPGDLQAQEKDPYKLVAYLAADNVALLGLPMNIVTYVVVLFVLMGQLLLRTGASEWFTDIATALFGRSRGGSAKIAVVASGLFGSISGSAVSNVASTGVITIPLMRNGGYSAQSAAAFEAVASTGGQIMPPIMGAAAFLMAELLEADYTDVILAAAIPAFLYYFAAFIQADLEAARLKIAPVPKDQIPSLLKVAKEGWFFLIPYVVLIIALFKYNVPPDGAALYASVSLPIVSWIFGYKGRRISLRDLANAVADTGRNSVDIIIIGAMAGLAIAIIETTGLGYAMTIVLLKVGQDSLLLLLVLTAIISIILGMGMPTTAIYLLLALMIAPPMIKLGVDPFAAHLFVLYFGLMSMITPPVAIAAFTAAKLANSSPMGTALTSCRLGWVAYVIPFVFVYEPSLIMQGSFIEIFLCFSSALIGIWVVSAGMLGYVFSKIGSVIRVICIISGLILILPVTIMPYGAVVKVVAAGAVCIILGLELVRNKHLKAEA
jgi:TRAP transporter 4TM/12TM fusion protein